MKIPFKAALLLLGLAVHGLGWVAKNRYDWPPAKVLILVSGLLMLGLMLGLMVRLGCQPRRQPMN